MAKKSTKRKPTKNQQEYAKQLSRIRKAISRLTKDGYRLQGNIIPETPKDAIRKRDIERLKKITPSTIREKATAISEITGKVISGAERFKEQLSERSRRSAETRKRQKLHQKKPKEGYKEPVSAVDIVEDRLNDLFSNFDTLSRMNLQKMLNREFLKYGRDRVLESITLAGDKAVELIERMVYGYKDKENGHTAYVTLAEIISGEIPTQEASKKIGDVLDAMESIESV